MLFQLKCKTVISLFIYGNIFGTNKEKIILKSLKYFFGENFLVVT